MNKINKIVGYLIVLLSIVGTTNAVPVEEWNRTYNVGSIESNQQTIDGGYIIIGLVNHTLADSPSYILKTNAVGNFQWSKNYTELLHSGQQTKDGEYILGGEDVGGGAKIRKTDANGNTLWTKSLSFYNGNYVQQTTDGGYVLMGCYLGELFDEDYMHIAKTDSNGNEVWYKEYGRGCIYSGQQTKDGGYILAGWTYSYDTNSYDGAVIKTNSNGNELWNKTFGRVPDLYSVKQTRDGGYIIAGVQNSDGLVIKTDMYGNKQWNKTFGGTNRDSLSSAHQTIDGSFILAGFTKSYGAGGYDEWIIKTDMYGNKQWSKTFGGTRDDFASSVYQTKDKGYILAGSKNSKAWLIKLIDTFITVVSPNGGENWTRGTIKSLKWNYSGNPGTYVKIELFKGGLFNKLIASNVPVGNSGSGSYNWNIPTTQTLGNDYKIKLTSTNNSTYTDLSNANFAIISQTTGINVTSPNGGENWLRGTIKSIKWTSSGMGPKVEIELWKGSPPIFDRLLGHLIRNNGSWNWTIPSTVVVRNDYRIKIWACVGNATACYYPYRYIGDMSNNSFRIS